MRLSLPLRIFLVHLSFLVVLMGLGGALVRDVFERYQRSWERELETRPAETLFSPLVSELARALLLRVEAGPPERRGRVRSSVARGLDSLLPTLTSIERLVVIDADGRVQYANETTGLGLRPAAALELASGPGLGPSRSFDPATRTVRLVVPVDDSSQEPGSLGWALITLRPTEVIPDGVESSPGAAGEPPVDVMWTAWAREVSRAILAERRVGDEDGSEKMSTEISEALGELIDVLPVEALIVVDRDRRIRYVSDPRWIDLRFVDGERAELLEAGKGVRREIMLASGQRGVETIIPVFDRADRGAETVLRRLGAVVIQYRPDPGLAARLPDLRSPAVPARAYLLTLFPFLAAGVGCGAVLAALTAFPVRRIERAVADLRARDFKGGLEPLRARFPRDLEHTVAAIREMGGRLEAMDAQGREREALLSTLAESLEDGMIVIGPDGIPVHWNRAAARILGLDETSPPESGQIHAALERGIDSYRRVADCTTTREIPLGRSDGKRVPVRLTSVPFELGPGVTGTLLLLRDLAALRRVEAHLLDAGRFAVQAHLAAGLAHEIRNPLHAIHVNACVLEEYSRRFARPDDAADSLKAIQQETQRLTSLLNNYLGMVRPGDEAGFVSLTDLCAQVVQLVRYAAARSRVTIELEVRGDPPPVHGLAGRLQQAVLNLVLNAIQAMPEGGVVAVEVEADDRWVKVAVRDTGPGLSESLSDQLFDTRVTTKPGGSGLGLPLVRMIAESHGGRVWYRSSPGSGATFTLALPAAAGPE